jgi:hypothetical protein
MKDGVNQKKENSTSTAGAPLPPRGLPVQIQCVDSKCMAFRDPEGIWINFFTRERITGFSHIIPNRDSVEN